MNNIPPLLQQIRENMLDQSNSESIRFNYRMTLENIRNFCDKSLFEYDKKKNKRR